MDLDTVPRARNYAANLARAAKRDARLADILRDRGHFVLEPERADFRVLDADRIDRIDALLADGDLPGLIEYAAFLMDAR